MSHTLVSLFAGVGGFDLGFERAGFATVGQCEIDPHAVSVLERHWPDTPKHDDVTTLTGMHFGPAEVVTFGSPCQDLSVAGKRAGLDGERSGLFLEAVRFIREMLEETNGRYPRVAVWENVVGAFSSNGGDDFAVVLESLVGGEVRRPADGWAYAGVAFGPLGSLEWRVLDSQHFGVAQRRRRVFLVYHPGSERAGQVLLEPQGVQGDPAEGVQAGKSSAACAEGSAGSGGTVWGLSSELNAAVENVPTLLRSSPSGGGQQPMVGLPVETAPTVLASWGHNGYSSPRGDGTDPIVPVASALTAREGKGPDSDVTTTLIPVGFNWQNAGNDGLAITQDGVGPLDCSQTKAVAFALRGREDGATPEVSGDRSRAEPDLPAGTLAANSDPHVATPYAVRRLTPVECERLQGFPEAVQDVIIEICTDRHPSPAPADGPSPKSPLPAGNAGSGASPDDAKSAVRSSPSSGRSTSAPARPDALMYFGEETHELHSRGKLLWSASTADSESLSRLPMQAADTVRLIAGIRRTLARTTLGGEAASPASEPYSIAQENGALRVKLYGDAITRLADAAGTDTHTISGLTKFITSNPSRLEKLDLTWITSCFSALSAITGFIPEPTLAGSSFTLQIRSHFCWTRYAADGTEIADTHRYRMMGNAVSVPVAEWIARRIQEAS